MKRALLVYESVPERTDFYLIENVGEFDLYLLETVNGKLMNCHALKEEERRCLEIVSDAVCEKMEYCTSDSKHMHCLWHKFKTKTPIKKKIDYVFLSGIVL